MNAPNMHYKDAQRMLKIPLRMMKIEWRIHTYVDWQTEWLSELLPELKRNDIETLAQETKFNK